MVANLALCLLAGALFGTGVVLLLARSLIRALLGILLMSNGANIALIIASGEPGRAPFVDKKTKIFPPLGAEGISDPLPQALMLTAIVITLAVTGFVLALAHRSWQLTGTDTVSDDSEDARIGRAADENDMSSSDYRDTSDPHSIDNDRQQRLQSGDGPGHDERREDR